MSPKPFKVTITQDGPYLVSGGLPLSKEIIETNSNGESVRWRHDEEYPQQEDYALCRCGQSQNKPFCDGSHERVGFKGTETASREPYLNQAELMEGPSLSLLDAESLCAFARFCDAHGKVWNLVSQTDDANARNQFVQETRDCPSGRLVAVNKQTEELIEPALQPSIVLVEDPAQECSGPIWLRGGIQLIGDDGFEYEVRNRISLCRCGASGNKPFCDGTHAVIKFRSS